MSEPVVSVRRTRAFNIKERPAASFTVPLQGVHPLGWVRVYTAISTPAQGVMCSDLKFVNTGAGAAGGSR